MWQWWNCAAASMPAGRAPLRINLDETSIALFQGHSKGVAFFRKRKHAPDTEPLQKASLATKRTCFTHVGLICDEPALQPLLPQVLIGNEQTFLERDMAALRAECPANVHLVRQKSAWNNAETCKAIIRLLAEALRPHLASRGLQPVLFLDAAPCHLHPSIFQCCAAHGIWPIVVPAGLTWLLQPLDTHAFLQYKLRLRARYHSRRAATADGKLTMAQFLPVVYDAIHQVLEGRTWATAFEKNGFGQSQAALSAFVLRQCQLENAPSIPSSLPTLELVERCWPQNRKVKYLGWILRPYRQRASLPAPAAVPAPCALPAPAQSGQAAPTGAPLRTVARGRPLMPRPVLPPAAPSGSGPVTRLQAALARGSVSSTSRPGKADRSSM